jgi:hypothetical protein
MKRKRRLVPKLRIGAKPWWEESKQEPKSAKGRWWSGLWGTSAEDDFDTDKWTPEARRRYRRNLPYNAWCSSSSDIAFIIPLQPLSSANPAAQLLNGLSHHWALYSACAYSDPFDKTCVTGWSTPQCDLIWRNIWWFAHLKWLELSGDYVTIGVDPGTPWWWPWKKVVVRELALEMFERYAREYVRVYGDPKDCRVELTECGWWSRKDWWWTWGVADMKIKFQDGKIEEWPTNQVALDKMFLRSPDRSADLADKTEVKVRRDLWSEMIKEKCSAVFGPGEEYKKVCFELEVKLRIRWNLWNYWERSA